MASLNRWKKIKTILVNNFKNIKIQGIIYFNLQLSKNIFIYSANGHWVHLHFFTILLNTTTFLYWSLKIHLPLTAYSYPSLFSFSFFLGGGVEVLLVICCRFFINYMQCKQIYSPHLWLICYFYYVTFDQIFNILNFYM